MDKTLSKDPSAEELAQEFDALWRLSKKHGDFHLRPDLEVLKELSSTVRKLARQNLPESSMGSPRRRGWSGSSPNSRTAG